MTGHQNRRVLLLSAGAACIAAAILAATAWLAWDMRERAFRDSATSIEKINLVLAEQTTRMLQGVDLVLGDLIRDIDAQDFGDTDAYRASAARVEVFNELRQRTTGVPQLEGLMLVDARGGVITSTQSFPPVETSVADRDFFLALAADPKAERFVSAPVQNRDTGAWTIYVSRRVVAADRTFLGIVVGEIGLRGFEDFYKQVYLGDNIAVSLWRADATLLARYPQSDALTGTPSAGAAKNLASIAFAADREWATGRTLGAVNPVPQLLTVRRVPDYPLFTMISVPEAAIIDRWQRASTPMIAGGLLISVAIGVIAWLLLMHFATERRAAEARAQRDKAKAALVEVEELSRAKSEFLAHMSHEMRTPLNGIIGFAEIMRDELMGKLGAPQYKGYAEDIYTSGKHLLDIVCDVVDFSQASAGRLTVDHEPVELNGLIDSVSSAFRATADKARLEYETKVPPDLPAVLGDEKRIKQVLVNLVSNAIKFTPAGGTVRVAARRTADAVEIRVEDTGIGLSAENLAKVFEPFRFVDVPVLALKNGGSGLGLSICKQLVELLGGTLSLESVYNTGTTVIVRLPLAAARAVSMAAE